MRALDIADIEALNDICKRYSFAPLVAHAPYVYNLASNTADKREFARTAMREDLERLELLPGNYYNFHPGSHVKQGVDTGIELIAEGLNEIIVAGQKTTVLLETMAGKGTEIGRSFEEIARILDKVNHPEHVGVCLDTCHVSDGGYDIVDNLGSVLDEFEHIIGIEKLKALHINDSKNPRGSHKDRHEKIGEGTLGVATFAHILQEPRTQRLPMILETPNDIDGYAREIALLRSTL